MKRRDFFRNGALTVIGSALINPFSAVASIITPTNSLSKARTAKNIIFMVSDGMSAGTLTWQICTSIVNSADQVTG